MGHSGGAQRSVNVCACLLPKHRKFHSLSVEAIRSDGLADLWIESAQNLCSRSMGKGTELSRCACAVLCCEMIPDKQFDFFSAR